MEKKGEANFDNRFYSLNVYKIFFFLRKKRTQITILKAILWRAFKARNLSVF